MFPSFKRRSGLKRNGTNKMNLIELFSWMHNNMAETFPMEELIVLALRISQDIQLEPEQDILEKSVEPLYRKESTAANYIQSYLSNTMLACRLCNRCNSRTNVVLSDGNRCAEMFIISDYPDLVSDVTGMPLAGPFEVKSSRCMGCLNLEECLAANFHLKCIPNIPLGKENQEVLARNKQIKNSEMQFPGKVLSDTATLYEKSSPEKFLFVRDNWKYFFRRLGFDTSNIKSNYYITSLIKCFSETAPTEEEINQCKNWLILEKELSSSTSTLLLGEFVYRNILPNGLPFEEAVTTVQKDPFWGDVLTYYHPRDIQNKAGNDIIEYRNMLGILGRLVRYSKEKGPIIDSEDIT
jgi:uracil-DNA glycosylase